ncbi:hypothetical protein HN51_051665 [Arachis hypogaea]
MSSSDRIELSIDPGTWNPMDEDMVSMDPIEFHSEEESESYKNRMDSYQRKTGLTETVQTGTGQLNGIPVAIGIMDFQFMGGSMGSVVGEKITRLVEHAGNQLLPLILPEVSLVLGRLNGTRLHFGLWKRKKVDWFIIFGEVVGIYGGYFGFVVSVGMVGYGGFGWLSRCCCGIGKKVGYCCGIKKMSCLGSIFDCGCFLEHCPSILD